jgi:hypothetical protein
MPGLLTIVTTIRIDGQQELSFGNRGDAEGSPRLRPTHWNVRRAANAGARKTAAPSGLRLRQASWAVWTRPTRRGSRRRRIQHGVEAPLAHTNSAASCVFEDAMDSVWHTAPKGRPHF